MPIDPKALADHLNGIADDPNGYVSIAEAKSLAALVSALSEKLRVAREAIENAKSLAGDLMHDYSTNRQGDPCCAYLRGHRTPCDCGVKDIQTVLCDALSALDATQPEAPQDTRVIHKVVLCPDCHCGQTIPANIQYCKCRCHPTDRAALQPEAPVTSEQPKRCVEQMEAFPFTSDHLWPCHHRHMMPSGGDCLNCGCSYAEYNSRFEAARVELASRGIQPGTPEAPKCS